MIASHAPSTVPVVGNRGRDLMIQNWADRVNHAIGGTVQAIIDTGRALCEAKAHLEHGEWERLFRDHPDRVRVPIQMSVRTAQRLMAIAAHPVLGENGNATPASLLPPSWSMLYELSTLPAADLIRAIEEGRIHPEIQRKDVRELLYGPDEDDGGWNDLPEDPLPQDPVEHLVHTLERMDTEHWLSAPRRQALAERLAPVLEREGWRYHPIPPGVEFCAHTGCRRRVRRDRGPYCWGHRGEHEAVA